MTVTIGRRELLAALGGAAAAWPLMARAQQPVTSARPRIALLALGPQQSVHLAFLDGLRRLGYEPGRNLDIDHRYGVVEQLKPLAQELIAFKPDILVADSSSPAIALKSVAPTLPIVCLTLTDAGIPDLFASYARPGGNVTGMAQSVEGVTGKLVEVALEIIPGARRIGFLSNPSGASMPLFAESVDVAAQARGMTVLTEQVSAAGELASAFGRFGKQEVQAVIVPVNGLFFSEGRQIAQLALAARLPTVGAERRYIEAGVLASYGIDQRESYRRGASYVDRILKGAKPGDLPIEFPNRIELAINLNTAKALGLDLPPSLITRADEVIE
jgi:putative tryptophan/tyrosine transport system substrate-binding protein